MRIRRSTFKKILQEELGSASMQQTDGGLGEQVTFAEYTSQNFDICPGAVSAFVKLKNLVSEHDEVSLSEDAMEMVDDLLGIEKDVLAKGFSTVDEFDQVLNLAGEARVKIGQLGALMGKSVAGDFSFINEHIMIVAKMLEDGQDEN